MNKIILEKSHDYCDFFTVYFKGDTEADLLKIETVSSEIWDSEPMVVPAEDSFKIQLFQSDQNYFISVEHCTNGVLLHHNCYKISYNENSRQFELKTIEKTPENAMLIESQESKSDGKVRY